jgi:hypothetical protein
MRRALSSRLDATNITKTAPSEVKSRKFLAINPLKAALKAADLKGSTRASYTPATLNVVLGKNKRTSG